MTKPKAVGLLLIPLALLVAPPSDAAPPEVEASGPIALQLNLPSSLVKVPSRLEVKNTAGVPGEPKGLEATLLTKVGDKPIAGKIVSFQILSGAAIIGPVTSGSGTTDAAGKVRASWTVPEMAQGNYTIRATFAGDERTGTATDDGGLVVVKAISAFDMTAPIVRCYPVQGSEHNPDPGACLIKFELNRTSDGKPIAGSVNVEVTGQGMAPVTTTLSDATKGLWLRGRAAKYWKVKVQFEGSPSYQAAAGEKLYIRPGVALSIPAP